MESATVADCLEKKVLDGAKDKQLLIQTIEKDTKRKCRLLQQIVYTIEQWNNGICYSGRLFRKKLEGVKDKQLLIQTIEKRYKKEMPSAAADCLHNRTMESAAVADCFEFLGGTRNVVYSNNGKQTCSC